MSTRLIIEQSAAEMPYGIPYGNPSNDDDSEEDEQDIREMYAHGIGINDEGTTAAT